jgi:DNA sulfur modification protein DndB
MVEIEALVGRMGRRPVYNALIRIDLAVLLFTTYDWRIDVEHRAQRIPKAARIPDIVAYLRKHPTDWIFPSFTVSFAGSTHFKKDNNAASGTLLLDDSEPLLVSDGQHRFLGLERALEELPNLGPQTISILFINRPSLDKAQQLFADLNKHAKTPPKSLLVLYDKSPALNRITVMVAERAQLFKDRVEKERTFVTKRSRLLTSLSALYQANERLFKYDRVFANTDPEAAAEYAIHVWDSIAQSIPQYNAVAKGHVSPAELREDTILASSLVFWALGDVAAEVKQSGKLTRNKLRPLGEINWSKRNRYWQGLVMLGTDIITRRQSREAMSDYLQYSLGIIAEPPSRVFDQHGNVAPIKVDR